MDFRHGETRRENSMGNYRDDRAFSDLFIDEIRRIVGYHVVQVASDEWDMHRNTDLMTFTFEGKTIAARIRDVSAVKWADEFTIRSHRDSGMETELSKIIKRGFGDWFFYGFGDKKTGKIIKWHLFDLKYFRQFYPVVKPTQHANGDGTYFLAYKYRHFTKFFIVAQSGDGGI